MRVAGIHKTSLIDGYGVNYVIFTQGCPHECEGCHNPSTHDPNGGYEVTLEELQADISSSSLIQGVTFSGGEPVDQWKDIVMLAKWCKSKELTTALYTGYILETNKDTDNLYSSFIDNKDNLDGYVVFKSGLIYFDYIIDGRFELENKTLDAPFRGSSNQRLLVKGVDY